MLSNDQRRPTQVQLSYCMNDGGVQMRVSVARLPMRQQRNLKRVQQQVGGWLVSDGIVS